jgi:uncharacterized damage-inducible protein DinB
MPEPLSTLLAIFRMNTALVKNCLRGVDDSLAARRPNEHTNSLAFLALHIVDARYWLARRCGLDAHHPMEHDLSQARSIEDLPELPPLSRIIESLQNSEAVLEEAFATADLQKELGQTFVLGSTVADAIAFMTQHDSYHLGQMALVRKYLGLPAMSYDIEQGSGGTGAAAEGAN